MSKPGQTVAKTIGYLTVLPPPDVLHRKLREAIETARARIEANEGDAGPEGTA